MYFWDFLVDFMSIITDIFHISLFSVDLGNGEIVLLDVGGLLIGLLILGTFLYYLIPRK